MENNFDDTNENFNFDGMGTLTFYIVVLICLSFISVCNIFLVFNMDERLRHFIARKVNNNYLLYVVFMWLLSAIFILINFRCPLITLFTLIFGIMLNLVRCVYICFTMPKKIYKDDEIYDKV